MMQQKINHYQALYREWLSIQAEYSQFLDHLHRQHAISCELAAFYFNEHGQSEWQRYYEAIEAGKPVDLTTNGEYSIMSQDTLWDMFCDERAFYEQLLQFAQQRLQALNNG